MKNSKEIENNLQNVLWFKFFSYIRRVEQQKKQTKWQN